MLNCIDFEYNWVIFDSQFRLIIMTFVMFFIEISQKNHPHEYIIIIEKKLLQFIANFM
jgi:hypothetical protein